VVELIVSVSVIAAVSNQFSESFLIEYSEFKDENRSVFVFLIMGQSVWRLSMVVLQYTRYWGLDILGFR